MGSIEWEWFYVEICYVDEVIGVWRGSMFDEEAVSLVCCLVSSVTKGVLVVEVE